MEAKPRLTVIQLISSIEPPKEASSSIIFWPLDVVPSKCCTWLSPIRIALAVINALITGWDKKLAMKPRRISPNSNKKTPERNARVIAAATSCEGSLIPSFARAAAVINESTATGPTESVLLVPKSA